jgi:hypothetical protein
MENALFFGAKIHKTHGISNQVLRLLRPNYTKSHNFRSQIGHNRSPLAAQILLIM